MWLRLGILTNKTRQQGIEVNADIIALSYTVTMSHFSYAEMFCYIASVSYTHLTLPPT